MIKKFAVMALALSVSGCLQYSKIETPPQKVKFTNATAQKNVHAFVKTAIRTNTFTKPNPKPNTLPDAEVTGAVCTLTNKGFRAEVKTPAYLEIPHYKGRADPITVVCRTPEDKVTTVYPAVNLTLQNINSSTASTGGLLGVLIVEATKSVIAASRNPANDVFGYPGIISASFGRAK
jgi:hypothetical protein